MTEQPDPASLSIDRLAGDSVEQRRAERLMLDLLERQLNCRLERPWRRSLPSGGRLEVDGGTDDPENALLVEAWAHQGPPKPAQRAKVLTDAFKLSFAATLLARRPRLLLLFSDKEAAAPFRSPRTWPAAAIREAGIEVVVVDLPEAVSLIAVKSCRQCHSACHSTRRYSAPQERTGWTTQLDLTCKDSTQQHAVDDPLLSCKQQVGVRAPTRRPDQVTA